MDMINELPQEILDSIMLKVPFESLVECLRVCKSWRTTIRGSAFKEKYQRQSRGTPRLLFSYNDYSSEPENNVFQSVSQEKPSLLSSKRRIRLNSDQELEMVSQPQQGLVCCSLENQFLLLNLGTKTCKPLPKPSGVSCYFGYDQIGCVFKLLVLSRVDLVCEQGRWPIALKPHVLTVNLNNADEEEGSWRPLHGLLPYQPVTTSVCIKGVIYWGAFCVINNLNKNTRIVSFNLRSEEFGFIDVPEVIHPIVDRLVNYHGKVCLVKDRWYEFDDGSRGYEFYVKDDNEDKLSPVRHRILSWRDTAEGLSVRFEGTTENGELVFATQSVSSDGSHFLLYYNAASEQLTKFKVEGGVSGDVEIYLDHYDTLLLT